MSDNNLQISFDYKYPDTAVLIVYRTFGGGMFLGDSARISVVKTFVGDNAVKMYSMLTGRSIDSIQKEAGVLEGNNENKQF